MHTTWLVASVLLRGAPPPPIQRRRRCGIQSGKLKFLPKFVFFWWKACSGILLTRANLLCKKIEVEVECVLCEVATESTTHVLHDCPYAARVWFNSPLGGHEGINASQSMWEWVQHGIQVLSKPDFGTFMMIEWAIWDGSNNLLWHNRRTSPEKFSMGALIRLQDFLRPNESSKGNPTSTKSTAPTRWQRPSQGLLKANVDGAWRADSTEGGVGIVVWDSSGSFVTGCALRVDKVFSAV